MNYANQLKLVLTNFEQIVHKVGSKNRFIQPIDFKYEAAAMRNLNGNTFKVWRYLLRWYGKPNQFYYSPAAIRKELGIGENGAATARKELEAKGYIKPVEGKHNVYTFTPVLPIDYELLKNKNDLYDDEEEK